MRLRRQFALVLAVSLMLVGVSAVSASADGPASAVTVTDLMADNGDGVTGFKAGEVQVWNDTTTLYVKYVITATDWCLMGTHLAVEAELGDIPQNRSNNPKVGQFEFSESHDCVTDYTYPMDLPGFDPVISAHADLRGLDTGTSVTMDSGLEGTIYGPLDAYAPPGDGAWLTPVPVVAPWEHGAWVANTQVAALKTAGAAWMSTAYLVENSDIDSWRWVHGAFNIPGEPTSGHTVEATADNEEEFWVNGTMVGFNDDWQIVTDYSSAFTPITGSNTYDFVFKNWAWPGGPTANPTGLIYSMTVNYRPYIYESGWAGTLDFGGKSWATYFTYNVLLWQEVDSVYVPAKATNGSNANEVVSSTISLASGVDYELAVKGTYTFAISSTWGVADAHCSQRPGGEWLNGQLLGGSWTNYLEVWVDGGAFNWAPDICDLANHEYTGTVTGAGAPALFTILDSHYTDNGGGLWVDLWTWVDVY